LGLRLRSGEPRARRVHLLLASQAGHRRRASHTGDRAGGGLCVAATVMKSSLSVRVTAGVLVVVAAVLIGGGFLIVSVTEQRDGRDAGGELQRIAGNLTPWVAGTLGIGRPSNSPGAVPLQLLDAHGQPVALPPTPNRPLPPTQNRPPPPHIDVLQPLRDAFAASGDTASPVGQIGFVRALNTQTGERLILGTVPRGFPAMSTRPGVRTTTIAGAHWRSAVLSGPAGLLIEVGAPERISARAASLRTTVIWSTIAGLAIALVATLLVTRLALRPLKVFRRKAARISDAEDLGTRVQQPGQPTEVAALAGELDGMLARLDSALAGREPRRAPTRARGRDPAVAADQPTRRRAARPRPRRSRPRPVRHRGRPRRHRRQRRLRHPHPPPRLIHRRRPARVRTHRHRRRRRALARDRKPARKRRPARTPRRAHHHASRPAQRRSRNPRRRRRPRHPASRT